jgi:hypothetical protein
VVRSVTDRLRRAACIVNIRCATILPVTSKEKEGGGRRVLNVPIPEEIEDEFTQAVKDLAASMSRPAATAVRLVIGAACRARNIPCPSDADLIGPAPGPRLGERGAKPARKLAKPRKR